MRHWRKGLLAVGLVFLLCVTGGWAFFRGYLPDSYQVNAGTALTLAQTPYIWASDRGTGASRTVGANAGSGSRSVQLRLFGVLPLKTVWVQEVQPQTVMVSGAPFGIKLFSDGVMVVGFSDIYTDTGYENPAKSAGLHMGDTIHSVNGTAVSTNEDIQAQVENSGGRPILVLYSRKGEEDSVYLTPVQDTTNGMWRVGMRVRDSSAGIGTLTYYDPASGAFAGLGHAVTDVDTGESIEVLSGQIVSVTITGVAKSSVGSPGELKGVLSSATAGDIQGNDQTGVFGKLRDGMEDTFFGSAMPVANRQEVTVGEVTIYACLDGTTPGAYQAVIERISYSEATPNKNMILRITDEELLSQTGGIVQGMSGSPIVQNGRLVGAVTHVLVNDPTRGYAIFAENMLEAQQSQVKNDELAA